MKNIKKIKHTFLSNKSGASYAISAVVITASTIALVLVASTFAYQTLDQQRGKSEFNLIQKALLNFDDGIRDVAWSLEGSRYTRFVIDYGQLNLFPENSLDLIVTAKVGNNVLEPKTFKTGYIQYQIPIRYITFGQREPFYVLGDSKTIITEGTESLGSILVSQDSDLVSADLSYRVRAVETSVVNVGGFDTSYVNIWVVKMKIDSYSEYVGSLDLTARAQNLQTEPTAIYDVPPEGNCIIHVDFGNQSHEEILSLNGNKVVFNFIISTVEISP
ncbi:MAG: hypothetical protein P8X91_03250 [Candidatus Bathyarchaeota archaeon]